MYRIELMAANGSPEWIGNSYTFADLDEAVRIARALFQRFACCAWRVVDAGGVPQAMGVSQAAADTMWPLRRDQMIN